MSMTNDQQDDQGTNANKPRVLITGAEGTIGSALREHLAAQFELRALTLTAQDFPSHVADVTNLAAIRPAFDGMDAVVHLAASPAITTPWEDILPNNLIGTYNVIEAARQAGVERFVFASSNHVIGGYEVDGAPELFNESDSRVYDHTVEIRPDSLYGVSKAYGEALGRYYHDQFGMKVYCLRIGGVVAEDDPLHPDVLERAAAHIPGLTLEQKRARMAAVWLSRRDCAELVARCLLVENVAWAVVYGISNNARQFWDTGHAKRLLGWEPRDGARA